MLTPVQINPALHGGPFTSYREHQWDAIWEVAAAFADGARAVFLDAPTGSGKSLAADTIRHVTAEHENTPYICTTLNLQDQVLRDFKYGRTLKGRANYPTVNYPHSFPETTCEDCTKTCTLCPTKKSCTYERAKNEALFAPLCVTNSAYYIREVNGPGRLGQRDLVVVDEADSFDDVIVGAFGVDIPRWMREDKNYAHPRTASNPEDIHEWLVTTAELAGNWVRKLERENERGDGEGLGLTPKQLRRRLNAANQLSTNLRIARTDERDWLYEGASGRSRKAYDKATLRPLWIGPWVEDYVWRHSKRWLLMSASFVSTDLTAHLMGFKKSEYAKVKVNYSFPPENRPIRYWPSDRPYTKKMENEGFDVIGDIAAKVQKICSWYPGVRILVHTQSHRRTEDLGKRLMGMGLGRPLHWFTNGLQRADAIEDYLLTPGSVLLGAGLERGYDFKDDQCRVNILAKCAYPDLGDKLTAARLRDGNKGQAWFDLQTGRAITQAIGRSTRSASDRSITFLLDRSFEAYLRGGKRMMLPPEVHEAVRYGLPVGPEMEF